MQHLQARVLLGINRVQGVSVPFTASRFPIRVTKWRLVLRFKELNRETVRNMPSDMAMHLCFISIARRIFKGRGSTHQPSSGVISRECNSKPPATRQQRGITTRWVLICECAGRAVDIEGTGALA